MLRLSAVFLIASCAALGQSPSLVAPATLPIIFTRTISADHARPGDPVEARTMQRVQLPGGGAIPSGARIVGHVLNANGFTYDKTPYAHQQPSILSIHFDSIEVNGQMVPLNVTTRAVAGPLAAWGSREPQGSDMDPVGTVTQIGGDQLIPSQSEVRNMDGDVVAYNKHDGVYAHLIANGPCDGSDVEVSVSIFSASACGSYEFPDISERGTPSNPSTLTVVSTHSSPKIWKHTAALLEVLPRQTASLER